MIGTRDDPFLEPFGEVVEAWDSEVTSEDWEWEAWRTSLEEETDTVAVVGVDTEDVSVEGWSGETWNPLWSTGMYSAHVRARLDTPLTMRSISATTVVMICSCPLRMRSSRVGATPTVAVWVPEGGGDTLAPA